MKKVDELSLDEISSVLQAMADEKGITREMLIEDAEKTRRRLMEERNVKA